MSILRLGLRKGAKPLLPVLLRATSLLGTGGSPELTGGVAGATLTLLGRCETGTVTSVSGSFKIDCSGHPGGQTQLCCPGILLATATDSLAPQAPADCIGRAGLPHVEPLRTRNDCVPATTAVERVEANVLPHTVRFVREAPICLYKRPWRRYDIL
jgi:hypothetical protein